MSVLAFSSDHSWALAANMGPALLYHNHLLKGLEHSMEDNIETEINRLPEIVRSATTWC